MEYREGKEHGKRMTLDAIVLDLCFDCAGEGTAWESRFDRCMREFHEWEAANSRAR